MKVNYSTVCSSSSNHWSITQGHFSLDTKVYMCAVFTTTGPLGHSPHTQTPLLLQCCFFNTSRHN